MLVIFGLYERVVGGQVADLGRVVRDHGWALCSRAVAGGISTKQKRGRHVGRWELRGVAREGFWVQMEGLSEGQRKLARMAILGWELVKDDSNYGQVGGSLQWHSNGDR